MERDASGALRVETLREGRAPETRVRCVQGRPPPALARGTGQRWGCGVRVQARAARGGRGSWGRGREVHIQRPKAGFIYTFIARRRLHARGRLTSPGGGLHRKGGTEPPRPEHPTPHLGSENQREGVRNDVRRERARRSYQKSVRALHGLLGATPLGLASPMGDLFFSRSRT